MMKKLLCITALASFTSSTYSENFLGYKNGFADLNINYLDWSHDTETKSKNTTRKKDFAYVELEGGSHFNWGELYGFFDIENPLYARRTEPGRNQRYTIKTTGRFYLGETGFNVYSHLYGTWSTPGSKYGGNFHEVNTLYGIGFNTILGNLWFKPFVAAHYVDQTYYSGNNGYVVGWVAGYPFKLLEESFMITNWHEMEFARHKRYGNGGRDGINGALAFWWNATLDFAAGVQYRYADNKLGDNFYQDAIIYTLKYTF